MLKQFFLKETNILWAIIINAIVIFFMYFPRIQNEYPAFYDVLDLLDHLFVLLFLMEVFVKLRVFKPGAYFADGWNIFDFVIAIASIPSFFSFLGLAIIPNTSVFKILRLLRLIRIFRFLQFIPHMDMIIAGLNRAIKSSIFVLIALFLLNFILALFTCHFYGSLVPEYFGNPLTSSYHIFQMFTVEGWNEIPKTIAEAAEVQGMANADVIIGLTRFYFILVVLFGGIFGMSLANAVFVDEMTMDNNRELEQKIDALQEQVAELKDLLK